MRAIVLGPALALALATLLPAVVTAHELGMNIHQSATVGPTATKDAGLKWVRIDMNWDGAELTEGVDDWAALDATVDASVAKGLSVLAVVGYTPAWASAADVDGTKHSNDVPVPGKYELFVARAVARYKDRVQHYELWNEPNLGEFFEGTSQQYIDLVLKPGSDAVRAECPTCKVLAAGLASLAASQYDLWLDAMLKQAADKFDIVNGHVYAAFQVPGGGAGITSDSFLNRLESHRIVKLGSLIVFEGPRSFKEVMDANSCTKPFWLTETGWLAAAGNTAEEDVQATFYRRVLEHTLTRPWWTTTIFYEGFDTLGSPHTWGMVVDDNAGGYTKKKIFDLLQKATQGLAFGGTKPACEDALDNDGDGLIDHPADGDCASTAGASEGAAPSADLGADGDGGVDVGADGGTMPGGTADASAETGDGGLSTTQNDEGEEGCAFVGRAPPSALSLVPWAIMLALVALHAARRHGVRR